MPTEIALWRVDEPPVRVHPSPMQLEKKLEDIIESDPAMLGEALMILGRQVKTDSGKVIDLLGIDAEGGLHVLELKRAARRATLSRRSSTTVPGLSSCHKNRSATYMTITGLTGRTRTSTRLSRRSSMKIRPSH